MGTRVPIRDETGARRRLAGVATLLLLVATVTITYLALAGASGAPVGVGIASGDSMGDAGDQVVVYSGAVEPAVGDVVVFDTGTHHGQVRHRVVGETDVGYRTSGDELSYVDQEKPGLQIPHATDENVLGTQLLALPAPQALGAALGVVAVLLALVGSLYRRELVKGIENADRRLRGGRSESPE